MAYAFNIEKHQYEVIDDPEQDRIWLCYVRWSKRLFCKESEHEIYSLVASMCSTDISTVANIVALNKNIKKMNDDLPKD